MGLEIPFFDLNNVFIHYGLMGQIAVIVFSNSEGGGAHSKKIPPPTQNMPLDSSSDPLDSKYINKNRVVYIAKYYGGGGGVQKMGTRKKIKRRMGKGK